MDRDRHIDIPQYTWDFSMVHQVLIVACIRILLTWQA